MAETIRVQVVCSPGPRGVREWTGEVPAGATVAFALQASGMHDDPTADPTADRSLLPGGRVGIWGRKCRLDRVLRDGDRVEVYRQLLVDPKVARRERFRKQGVKTAGLFAQRRAGAKAGY